MADVRGYFETGKDLNKKFGDCVLMQFTGLLSKSGVEIYEGDILEYKYKEPEKQKLYNRIVQVLDIRNPIIGSEYCEVIGNIYEHPDLLTK